MMQTLQRCREAQALWALTMPHIKQPEPDQFARWSARFSDELIEQALTRAARKFSPHRAQPQDPASVHRFITGLLCNLEIDGRSKEEACQSTL